MFTTDCFSASHHHNTLGMVVSEERIASDVGASILKAGGNAVDAAVAVGYALAVVDSCCGNIGGGGFMLIHTQKGQNVFLNFREKAPLNASADMFMKYQAQHKKTSDNSVEGYLAVGVPGTVMGLDTALQKYGTLPRKTVMAPAIHLARDGYIVSKYQAQQFAENAALLAQNKNVAALFLQNGKTYAPGARLVQKDLANTLQAIADYGPQVFYHGRIAKAIVKASHAAGGILSLADFADYHVEWLKPTTCRYHDVTVLSAPPPSSGGTVICEALGILKHFSLASAPRDNEKNVRAIIEAMGYGFRDRNHTLGDPDFVHNPEKLTSNAYTRALSEKIKNHPGPLQPQIQSPQFELTDTTHYSVMDSQGNAVSVTYTLNGFFGAGIIAGNTGFLLNDEMDDFATNPNQPNKFGLVQSEKNNIAPGKRPLSSMSPTIVLKNGKVMLVTGSPGGPRIITAVLLSLINLLDYHMPLQNAIDAPRYHYQAEPNIVFTEANAFSPTLQQRLTAKGYHIEQQTMWAAIAAIENTKKGMIGAIDSRRPDGGVSIATYH